MSVSCRKTPVTTGPSAIHETPGNGIPDNNNVPNQSREEAVDSLIPPNLKTSDSSDNKFRLKESTSFLDKFEEKTVSRARNQLVNHQMREYVNAVLTEAVSSAKYSGYYSEHIGVHSSYVTSSIQNDGVYRAVRAVTDTRDVARLISYFETGQKEEVKFENAFQRIFDEVAAIREKERPKLELNPSFEDFIIPPPLEFSGDFHDFNSFPTIEPHTQGKFRHIPSYFLRLPNSILPRPVLSLMSQCYFPKSASLAPPVVQT